MRKRFFKCLIMLAAFLAAGFIYFILVKLGISLRCIFYEITGLYCPGCGITRACSYFIQLEFSKAFRCNQIAFFVIPVISVIAARKIFCYIKTGNTGNEKWMNILCYITIPLLIIFGILRNIPFFEFLQPI